MAMVDDIAFVVKPFLSSFKYIFVFFFLNLLISFLLFLILIYKLLLLLLFFLKLYFLSFCLYFDRMRRDRKHWERRAAEADQRHWRTYIQYIGTLPTRLWLWYYCYFKWLILLFYCYYVANLNYEVKWIGYICYLSKSHYSCVYEWVSTLLY